MLKYINVGSRSDARRRLRPVERDESGQAILLVASMITVALTVPAVVIAATIGQIPMTSENLNWNSAYEAAEAGLNDYIQDLDAAGSFTQWTTGRAVCPASSSNANEPAFCGWVSINPSFQTNPPEWYEYALPSTKGGGLQLTVSGKAGTGTAAVVRTFTYRIVPQNTFLDDIYWTNYETTDPVLNGSCTTQYYSSSYSPSNCWIQFDSNDTLNGPLFSNDTFRICGGPTFNGPVDSAASSRSQPLYVTGYNCTLGTPSGQGWPPSSVGNEPLPTTVAEASAASYVGCYIAGSSSTSPASNVKLTLSVSGGVTTATYTGGTAYNVGGNGNNCASGFTVDNLTSELIYVLGNVTITAGSQVEGFMTVVAGASASNGQTFTRSQAGYMYINGNVTYPSGDLTASGTYYEQDNSDGLGLIADYFIEPQTSGGGQPCSSGTEEIDAAVLALQDSFYNPNYTSGSICTLKIVGSLAQSYRGAVGTLDSFGNASSGYVKNYIWDSSFAEYWPPYYLSPNSATWGPATYTEAKAGCANRALSAVSC